MLLSGPPLFRLEPHLTDKLFNLEEIDAGKLHALVNRIKAHPASVKVILVLFSDRENLLLLTLDGHRLHGKQAQPLCFARDAPRFSHRVQLGRACFSGSG